MKKKIYIYIYINNQKNKKKKKEIFYQYLFLIFHISIKLSINFSIIIQFIYKLYIIYDDYIYKLKYYKVKSEVKKKKRN